MRTLSLFYIGYYVPLCTRTAQRTDTDTPQTLWGDQCLDDMACEGSMLIRPTLMLCLEIL